LYVTAVKKTEEEGKGRKGKGQVEKNDVRREA